MALSARVCNSFFYWLPRLGQMGAAREAAGDKADACLPRPSSISTRATHTIDKLDGKIKPADLTKAASRNEKRTSTPQKVKHVKREVWFCSEHCSGEEAQRAVPRPAA